MLPAATEMLRFAVRSPSAADTFEIGSLHAASYRLSVVDTGRPMQVTKAVKLALSAGQHATGVEVVVERPGRDDAPIADAWL